MEGKNPESIAAADSRVQHWKTKYLDSLETHEEEQTRQEDLIRVLRRGLLSVSLLGDGLDPQLDQRLNTLRELLQKLGSNSSGLDDLLQSIETDLLRMDCQRNQEAAALKFTLSKSISGLLECKSLKSSDYSRALKRMQKEVRKSSEDRHTQHGLLKDFAALLTALLTDTPIEHSGQQPGFWHKLSRSLVPNSQPASAAKPPQPEESTASAAVLAQPTQSLPEHSEVVQQVNEFISQVLDSLSPVDAVNAVAIGLQTELKKAGATELPLLLQKTLNVINMARASEQKQLKDYLQSVHQSLEDLSTLVNKSQHHNKHRSDLDRRLDADLRFDLNAINNHVSKAQDLDKLKLSIQEQLEKVITTVDNARDARQEVESAYSSEIRQLMAKVECMEKESRLLHESVTKQQAAMRLDSLTSLHNRNAYFEKIAEEFEVWKATADKLCLCLGDIDFLHKLNESHGHSVGDRAIQLIAQEIGSHLRKSDFLARYGGEQFVMILPATSADVALDAMENIREHIDRCKFNLKDSALNITVSFGITEFGQGDTIDTAFTRVEHALLQAKNSGRNCCRVNRGH
jgi:diguanylate cyclase